jgi:hypothetical protein
MNVKNQIREQVWESVSWKFRRETNVIQIGRQVREQVWQTYFDLYEQLEWKVFLEINR